MSLLTLRNFTLPRILDERGNLSVFENDGYFPFSIECVSWLCSGEDSRYDTRLGSSPFDLVVIVLAGSLKLWVKEGLIEEEVLLDDACNCICLPAHVASRISWSSADTCAFIAASAAPGIEKPMIHIFPNNKAPLEQYELLGQ
jgi:hypothetical protein